MHTCNMCGIFGACVVRQRIAYRLVRDACRQSSGIRTIDHRISIVADTLNLNLLVLSGRPTSSPTTPLALHLHSPLCASVSSLFISNHPSRSILTLTLPCLAFSSPLAHLCCTQRDCGADGMLGESAMPSHTPCKDKSNQNDTRLKVCR